MFVRNIPLAVLILLGASCATGADNKPNIVFILADDLGYGDLGCYGQTKIRTPNLDKLAREGMRFTQHYSGSPVCAPSRAVLMTGLHPGHAPVRNNREAQPEGQFPIPAETVTLAEHLKKAGYTTGAFGKWGLGPFGSTGDPLKQGIDRFYGYNCQRAAHTFYPETLYDNDKIVKLDNPPMPLRERLPAGADPSSTASFAKYKGSHYSADLIAEEARRFVQDNKDNPFFLYWPTTVPHLGLQAPEDSVAEYEGKWDDPPYTGNKGYVPNRTPRATYAAMITRMDKEIGRLLDLLNELKLADNTIVIFTSDNGPASDKQGGTDTDFFNSNGGLRDTKGSLYEGGSRVPLIVKWPGKTKPGSKAERVTGFEDWIPTLLEVAGAQATSTGDGISFAPTLLGKQQPERPFLYREFPAYGGQQSIRAGKWKAIRQNLKPERKDLTSPTLELYDIESDPGERHDMALRHPEILKRLMELMTRQHIPSTDFPFPVLDEQSSGRDRSLHN